MARIWLFALLLCGWASAQAQTLTTISNFNQQESSPFSILRATDGNFYGLSLGSSSGRTTYRVTPAGALGTVYSFVAGEIPNTLIQASDGNFYGTSQGGKNVCSSGFILCGYVFKLSLSGTLSTLYSFSGTDGFNPTSLVQGKDGNLYGITVAGGAGPCPGNAATPSGCGVFFKVTTAGAFTRLYDFDLLNGGAYPSSLILGADGNFYGTTQFGGSGSCSVSGLPQGCGVVFKLTPQGAMTQVYNFSGANNLWEPSELIQGADENFYGIGAIANTLPPPNVQIFKVTPSGTFTTVYDFTASQTQPAVVIQGTDGNLYGISNAASLMQSALVFQLTSAGKLTTLSSFPSNSNHSTTFLNALIEGSDGNFYGTTYDGGANNLGSLFELAVANPNAPAIATTGGVLNGASFLAGIGANAWMTIKGTNLAMQTDTWTIAGGVLPAKLDGVSVMVGGQPAYVQYVSAGQINVLAPNIPPATVPVTVTTSNGTSPAVMAQIQAEQPAFFQWGNYAVATRQDFSLAVKNGTFPGTTTVPAKPGDVIILWGTGFGPTSPTAPVGKETPSDTTYNTANMVTVAIGTMPATVYGAALAPGFAGLYQIAIQVPALTDGDYQVVASVAGASSPMQTMITVQQ